ncbi:uncharacterized protein KY384_001693 [Bacidia gigantensis]|uniref:uncharacterized protein n=1 Tax=Bacidia gigantensis TaxID=2732470 RepID=UPI001D040219|nr:uncharacterized protein KY384_001693 [Bacidia gigantensis]KAG8533951.1 hypothetical protein KY384_001693 [Bacidia gigantensis]
MSTPIPTSTSVRESAVIPAPLSHVWHLIKLQSFPSFWTSLKSAEEVKRDGTRQEIKQEEHSALEHFITYSVITSEPALTYTSVMSTVRCWEVSSGEQEGSTFVVWTGSFSGDADAGVIEDARFKRKEALADLAKAVVKK